MADFLKALLEFLRNPSPKVVASAFLSSALWLILAIPRWRLLPLPISFIERGNVVAVPILLFSGFYLLLAGCDHLRKRVRGWSTSDLRKFSHALKQATPLERVILEKAVQAGENFVALDAGSPVAMHLQQIGLIEQVSGLAYTTYWMVPGLRALCIKNPSFLAIADSERISATRQLDALQYSGQHPAYFARIQYRSSPR